MPDSKPAVVPTRHNLFFWAGARERQLFVQRCGDCGRYQHPPMPLCGDCGSRAVVAAALSGRGRIYAHTLVRRVFHPGFADEVPYVLALIELAEQANLRLLSKVVDCVPETLAVGQAVQVDFEPHGEWALPVFRLAETGAGA